MPRNKEFSRITNPRKKGLLDHQFRSSIFKEYPLLRHLTESQHVEIYTGKAQYFIASMNDVIRQLKRRKAKPLIDEQIIITSPKDDCSAKNVARGVLKMATLHQSPETIPQLWIQDYERARSNIVLAIAIRYPGNRRIIQGYSLIEDIMIKKNCRHRALKMRYGI